MQLVRISDQSQFFSDQSQFLADSENITDCGFCGGMILDYKF